MVRWLLPLIAVVAASAHAGTQSNGTVTFLRAEWETTMTVVSMDAPTLPGSVRQTLRQQIEALGGRTCMGGRSEDAVREFRTGFLDGLRQMVPGGSCTFSDRDSFGGGRIRTEAICNSPNNPVEARVALAGTYTDSAYGADFDMTFARPGAAPLMRVRARVEARVIGPCGPQA
ncbi:MAG: DUF3617 domain-containing protein [Sphingomonas sp.]